MHAEDRTAEAVLTLTGEERDTLVRWSRRASSAQALALRCRIVLACADGLSNVEVAQRLGVTRPTVGRAGQRLPDDALVGGEDVQAGTDDAAGQIT